jgi:hypothetical protein
MNDSKILYEDRLTEVLGPLRERLFEIENCDISKFIPSPSGRYYISFITTVCFNFPQTSILKVDDTIDHIKIVRDRLPEIFERVKLQFDAKEFSPFEDTEKQIQKNEKEFGALCADITSELQSYEVSLEQLSEKLCLYAIDQVIPDSNKLQFNLTVEELGVFLRLLKEADIIPKKITNLSIAKSAVDHVTTKGGGARRIKKMKDCISSRELKTWETIKEKIAEMDKICHLKIKVFKS